MNLPWRRAMSPSSWHAASDAPLPRCVVDQLVDGVADATTEVFDVEPPYRPHRLLVPFHVQAEIGCNLVLARDDVVLAGFNGVARTQDTRRR